MLPFFIVVYIILYAGNNGKVFFKQERPGKDEKLFHIIKFKTMNDKVDENGKLLPDSERLTNLGRIIRKTSVDELPQLINVLKGEMSFIGPRPLLVRYLPYYTTDERRRHSVRPGITGLAQISGRNLLDWDQRLSKDVEYVNSVSLKTDMNIFIKTIKKVLLGKDVIVLPDTKMIDLDESRKKQH